MSTLSPESRKQRARIASLTRSRPADDPDLVEARRALKGARLADHVQAVLASAPPLTADQRQRVAALLTAGGASK